MVLCITSQMSLLQSKIKSRKEAKRLVSKDEVNELKADVADKYLGGKCFFCGAIKSKRGMTIHHRWYIKNDVVYHDYPKNHNGKMTYHKNLRKKVRERPSRFRYLCNTDHQSLERLLRYSEEKFEKLVKEVRATRKLRRKHQFD